MFKGLKLRGCNYLVDTEKGINHEEHEGHEEGRISSLGWSAEAETADYTDFTDN